MKYIKPALMMVAAWAFGLWTGINYTAKLVDPQTVLGKGPKWVGQAEWMNYAAIAVMALSVAVWIYLDYRGERQ